MLYVSECVDNIDIYINNINSCIMDEVKLYTIKEIANETGIQRKAIQKRIKKLMITHVSKNGKENLYNSIQKYQIKEGRPVRIIEVIKEVLVYEPLRIETTYHIYESKMNY